MNRPAVHPGPAEDSLLQALLASDDAVLAYFLDHGGFPRNLACANAAACTWFGCTTEEMRLTPQNSFIGLKEQSRATQLLKDLHRRSYVRFQSEVISGQGSLISAEVTAMLATYTGQPAAVVICRNTESFRRKESLLRIVKRRYRAIIQDQTEAIFRFLPSGRVTFINHAGSKAFGLTAATALKTNLFAILPAETAQALRLRLRSLSKDMAVQTFDCTITRPNSEPAAFEWTIRAIYARQTVIEYQVAGRDITLRKKLENELINHRKHLEELVAERTSKLQETQLQLEHELLERALANASLLENETQLRTLINTLPNIICFKDGTGRWLEVNTVKLNLLGLTDVDYKGKTDQELAKLCPPCCRSTLETCWVSDQATWFAGTAQTYTEVITGVDGIQRTFEVKKIPLFYPGGAKKGLVVVGHDMTEHLLAMEAQKQLEAEKTRTERFNLVGEMAVNIGHEIRNPMTTVRGYLQMLQNKLEFSKYQSWFELMIGDLDKANSIITNFISLAKNKAIRLVRCDLNELIGELLPDLQTRALLSQKNIIASLGDIPQLALDKKEITQLILNLVDNGLYVTPQDETLAIATSSSGGYTILEISDKGPGIPETVLEKLGMPFLTTKEDGTGLGLAVCYHIAQRHHAKLDILTACTGTTVRISFKESA